MFSYHMYEFLYGNQDTEPYHYLRYLYRRLLPMFCDAHAMPRVHLDHGWQRQSAFHIFRTYHLRYQKSSALFLVKMTYVHYLIITFKYFMNARKIVPKHLC